MDILHMPTQVNLISDKLMMTSWLVVHTRYRFPGRLAKILALFRPNMDTSGDKERRSF